MADVRTATAGEIPRLAETLASAFEHDPLLSWMTPEGRRLERMRRFFSRYLVDTIPHESVHTTEDVDGVAIWLPPEKWKVPTGNLVRMMPTMVRSFGTRLPRVLGCLSTIEKKHPKDPPHWYLEFLGTRRDRQRKGVGSSLISLMLDRCDQEGMPAYLEASSPENVPFYGRHGFEVVEEVQLKNGPTCWRMWRESR
jgi:ribosomal protein S18 acetylase RimI-like enzyme